MSAGRLLQASVLGVLAVSCASGGTEPGTATPRSYRMGFSPLPPRLTVVEVLRTIDSVSRHGDAALLNVEIPWAPLLADTSAAFLVRRDQLEVARLFQQRGLPVTVTLDVTNGLDRAAESDALRKLGRSIAEPAVQRVYREYAAAFDSIVKPSHLALAMETNLIRQLAPAPVYAAVVTMTNAAAAQLRAAGSATPLMVSVQVEAAWGRLGGSGGGTFVGIRQDRTDFPFTQALGLSSYPYLGGFVRPEDIPDDYYTRLVADAPLPMLVVEGGWSSGSVGAVTSSLDLQARYVRRQMQLADAARLLRVFQITFTDLDLATITVPPGSILPLFAQLGMVDTQYRPKPALVVWDSVRAVPLAP